MADIYVWIVLAGFMNSLIPGCLCQTAIFREKRSSHGDEEEHGEEDGGNENVGHSDHSSIINSLFEKYDPSASPTHGSDEPTIITVNVQVLSMDEINDSKMEYVIDTRMTFSWTDKRLIAENCKEKNLGCDDHFDMKGRADKLWFPDLYILNARIAINHDQPLKNGMIYLKGSGEVMLSKRLTLTLRCPMNLCFYPMDTQKCPLIICPYSLTESELKLAWMANGVSLLEDFQRLQNFRLIPPVMTGQMKWRYDGPDVSGLFSCVNATFLLERLNGYHMVYSYTVTTFIVMVSWISFWLPVTAVPARVTLGITTLLTLLTTANYLRSSLPTIAYATAIDIWVVFCTFFVFASLILYPISFYEAQKKSLGNHASLKVERLNGYHMVYSYTVTTFIVMVSWISFWLPVTAVPARVTLGITTLLTLLTTANYLRSSLPTIAYATAIDIWVVFCTFFVFASLILCPISFYEAQKKSLKNHASLKVENKVGSLARKCILCCGNKDALLKLPAKEGILKSDLDHVCRKLFPTRVCPLSSKCQLCGGIKDELLKLPAKEDNLKSDVDSLCRKLFPVGFAAVIVSYSYYFITETQNTR